jgi:predicted nucleic acid-binding protein
MRIYLDSNVFGAYPTSNAVQEQVARQLFGRIVAQAYQLVVSDVILREITDLAPTEVQDLLLDLMALSATQVEPTMPVIDALADAYIQAGVVTARHRNDALHVAFATITGCDALASWNTREFSNKEVAYNQVNTDKGYGTIVVRTPDEVLRLYP